MKAKRDQPSWDELNRLRGIANTALDSIFCKDLARRIREFRPDIATLFMSGYPADAFTKRNIALGEQDYLRKPFSQEQLARAVREALDAAG